MPVRSGVGATCVVSAVDVDAFLKQLSELLRASSGAEYSSVQQLVFSDGEVARLAGLAILLPLACPVRVLRDLIVRVPVFVVRVRLGR